MFIKSVLFENDTNHGYFIREGGVSRGLYASLNCGYGSKDSSENVTENRHRAIMELNPGHQLLTVHQIHSATCTKVREPWTRGHEPKADAMVTERRSIILGILTADCGPVLFYGRKLDGSPVIGAAHAGWSGALRGVLENTIDAMKSLGVVAETLCAALGPCIGPQSYEVSKGFELPFLQEDAKAVAFFAQAARPEHLMFDLSRYILFRLKRAGVGNVEAINRDTCAEEQSFFSYRRSVLRGESDYGRQLSAISIL